MEQMCLSKQKHNKGSHKPSLGEEKCLCDLETRQVHAKDMWSIPRVVASLSSHHPMSIAACHTPQHLSELVSAPKAAKLACKLLILTVLPVEDLAF